MTLQILIPVLALAVIALLLTSVLYRVFPQRLSFVLLNVLLSALIMTLAGTALFAVLYALQSPTISAYMSEEPGNWALFLLKLGLMTGFIWGPVLLFAALSFARKAVNRE